MFYCFECDNEKDFRPLAIQQTFNVKEKTYTLQVEAAQCVSCGQICVDPDQFEMDQQQAFNMYRDEKKLLQPDQIIGIRRKYGLAADSFSELLGFGKKTMWRYENGSIQDEAQNNLILLMNNPENFSILYEKNKDCLTEKEQQKVEEKLSELIFAQSSVTAFCITDTVTYDYTVEMQGPAIIDLPSYSLGRQSVRMERWDRYRVGSN